MKAVPVDLSTSRARTKELFKDLKDYNRTSADFSQLLTQDSVSPVSSRMCKLQNMCAQPFSIHDSTRLRGHLSGYWILWFHNPLELFCHTASGEAPNFRPGRTNTVAWQGPVFRQRSKPAPETSQAATALAPRAPDVFAMCSENCLVAVEATFDALPPEPIESERARIRAYMQLGCSSIQNI